MQDPIYKDKVRLAVYGGILLACICAALWLSVLRHPGYPQPLPCEASVVLSTGSFSGTLHDVLKKYGLTEREKYGISTAFSKSIDLKKLKASDPYTIALSTGGAFKYIVISKAPYDHFVFAGRGGGFSHAARLMKFTPSSARFSGTIASSLWESMSARGVPPDLILDFADVFSCSVDFLTEVRAGDKFELVYESMSVPGGRIVSKKILAAVYEGKETGRKMAGYYKGNYYDERGDSVVNMFLRAPLHFRRISSYFTLKRFHPILKYVRAHLGIDYAAPSGTPVSAVADGTVLSAGWNGGFGNYIEIRHAMGYVTAYGHLKGFRKGLRRGMHVSQGEVIAYVGSTGLSSGPHLDFRVRQNGKPLNFLKIKHRSGGSLGGKDKTACLGGLKKSLPKYFK